MNLLLLILIPLATALAVLTARTKQQVRWVSFIGASIQLFATLGLLSAYRSARAAGQNTQMLFEQQYNWFPNWNISFHIGVDGIAVAMILLTAFVVVAGVLVSWNVEKMTKEFYFCYCF